MRIPDHSMESESSPGVVLAMRETLVQRFFPAALRAQLDLLGPLVILPTRDDLLSPESAEQVTTARVLVTCWSSPRIDAEVLDRAPALRGIVHSAGSVRATVDKECYRRGIVVSSQAWANALPVAEYTLAMILLGAKGVLRAERAYRSDRRGLDVKSLLANFGSFGRRVGIVGASMIGRRVIELLRPFDLEVVLFDPTITARDVDELYARLVPLDELMATSAVVSLHAPLLPGTRHMIGTAQLRLMGDGAVLINTARGGLVDQTALIAELTAGRIDAVLDVTEPEVPEQSSPLWDLPNVVLTPHVAGSAGNEQHRLGASAVAEVARVLREEPLLHPVTESRYDMLA